MMRGLPESGKANVVLKNLRIPSSFCTEIGDSTMRISLQFMRLKTRYQLRR